MLHSGIYQLFANLPMGFQFPGQIHSSPTPSPPNFASSWRTSKSAAFSIDAILGRPAVQSQQQHNQHQYQQHIQKKAVLDIQHHQQQHQQQQHHQIPYQRISRPAPYPSSVSSGSANDITSGGSNIIVNNSSTNTSSSVRNNSSNSSSGGKASKTKRIRTIFTAEQLERLEAEFARQQYMVGPERVYLAATLQLSEAQVKVWFQNRRIKWRKQYMESQHARFQDHPSMSDSNTDRAESRSPTSPLADVDAVSTHDTSDDDRVDVGSSSPPRRASSLSPPPPASAQGSRSPSPTSSESSSSSTPSSAEAEDKRSISNCGAVSGPLGISYSSSVTPTLSHYLSVTQLSSSMMAVKDQLAKAQRSLH